MVELGIRKRYKYIILWSFADVYKMNNVSLHGE